MSTLENVNKLPERFLYTNVLEEKGTIYALGYDLDTNKKVLYTTRHVNGLGYYLADYNNHTKLKTFVTGVPLRKYQSGSISEFKKAYWDKGLSDHIHGHKNPVNHFINNECVPKMEKDIDAYIKFADENFNIGYFDIETKIGPSFPIPYEAEFSITAITLYCTRSKVFYVFADQQVSDKGIETLKIELANLKASNTHTIHPDATIDLRCYDNNEEQLLVDFARVVSEEEVVDVLTGWNSELFDVPYVYFRMKKLFGPTGPNMLSPIGKTHEYWNTKKEKFVLTIKGINLVDSMNWYKDFTKNIKIMRSYSLDYICKQELGMGKHKLPGTLKVTYEKYYDEYIKYNFLDTVRLFQLIDHKKFFLTAYVICFKYYTIQLEKIFSPVLGWDNILLKETMKEDLIFPHREKGQANLKFPGAFVKEVVPGFYRNIASFDVNSMYPHIQMGWNISPETHIDDDEMILKLFNNHPLCKAAIELRKSAPDLIGTDEQCIWWDKNVLLPIIHNEIDLSFLSIRDDICMTPTLEFYWLDVEGIAPKKLKSIYGDRKKLTKMEDDLHALAEEVKDTDPTKSKEYTYNASLKKLEQIALKVVINAEYGAFASSYFHFNSMRIARSIILTGRYLIQSCGIAVEIEYNKFLRDMFNAKQEVNCWPYSDTDSVAGDSIINVNGNDIKIEDFIKTYDKDKEYITPSVNAETSKLEYNKISYVWKNRVKKRMFKIKTNENEVVVTEDHSIIIERDGIICDIKPRDIIKTDKIMKNTNNNIIKTDEFEIEDLGIQDMDVYDIEVENNHNFFANNILVHNSCYFTFDEMIQRVEKNNGKKFTDATDIMHSFCEQYVQPWINKSFSKHIFKMNAKNTIIMKREVIAPKGMWRATKKHYALLISDEKGTRYKNLKLYLKGTQFVSTSIPEDCKAEYDIALRKLVSSEDPRGMEMKQTMIELVEKFRQQFKDNDINDLCQSISVNKINKYSRDGNPIKGAPKQVKAALAFNKYIQKNRLVEQGYQAIQSGSKIRLLPLLPNHGMASWVDTFGFIDELPPHFDNRYIDYEELFIKNFSKYLSELFKELSLNWDISEQKNNVLVDDAF